VVAAAGVVGTEVFKVEGSVDFKAKGGAVPGRWVADADVAVGGGGEDEAGWPGMRGAAKVTPWWRAASSTASAMAGSGAGLGLPGELVDAAASLAFAEGMVCWNPWERGGFQGAWNRVGFGSVRACGLGWRWGRQRGAPSWWMAWRWTR